MRRGSIPTVALLMSCLLACERDAPAPRLEAGNTGLRYLSFGGDSGFAKATEPRAFIFPDDHGPHAEFRTEWWYFTGNLDTKDARHFGFELTFFRYALRPASPPSSSSDFRASEIFMAHFAVTDVAGEHFAARERMARGALGLAGAAGQPLRVWVKDWSATLEGPQRWRLEASDSDLALDLTLDAEAKILPQGDDGLDRKGAEPGNASYYYSVPRLRAEGQVGTKSGTFDVAGTAWLDREWSTSALEADVAGWDWFALQLSDGASLMFYRLRLRNGDTSPFSGGTYVGTDGNVQRLGARDVEVIAMSQWRSERTGVLYPSGWRLRVSPANAELRLTPFLEAQELDLSVRYWEGAVEGEGTTASGPVSAQGYVELTGY